MDQPEHDGAVEDPATIPRSESRLKRLSGVTANRLSIPFSLFSFRSSRTSDSEVKRLSKQQNGGAKSSQPSESTRTSTTTEPLPDEQDAVGQLPALPVLGTSRGGYLRSLLSLFSDGHDHDGRSTQTATPVSVHTPLSDISPWPRSLGLYEYDLNSPVIYRFSKNHQLYIGWPDVVNPPPEALVEFETETLPLLEQDLRGICAHLSQQDIRITYELRMSGHADLTAGTVTLAPTVWILYRSYTLAGNVVTAAALNQVALGLDYLQTDIEIHEGGGRIEASSDRKLVDVDLDLDAAADDASTNNSASNRDSIQLSNGAVLSVHVESCRGRDTACGALVCVTVQEDKLRTQQSLCRLGGLLKINGRYVLGVTTAHAMLDSSGIFKDSFDGGGGGDGDGDLRTPKGKAVDRDAIVLEAGEVEPGAWQPATRDAAIDFLGISMNSRGDVALNRARPQNATDFAMLRLRDVPPGIRNRYVPPGSDAPVTIRSTASASSSALDEGPVYLLGGAGRVADAQLVWGSVCFIIRGRNFRVRRVQTAQPLGPAASGSWVVKGEVLYGVIIAVYKDEPFALMMTAERLFESILGSAFSVRTVELWDGVLPEAEKPEARVGRTRSATTATTEASSSKTAPKRDSSTRTNGTRAQTESSRPSTLTRSSTTQVRDFQLKADGPGGDGGGGGGGDPAEVLGLHPALRGQEARDKRAAKRASMGSRAGRLLAPSAQVRSYLDKKLPMLVRRASKGRDKGKDKGKKVDRGTPTEGA
ncbi:hypothetical protein KVR01_007084 [Diaporthe batatas]|uniref:uncharacterized protein n=1 Tax=Diaporthe batatas TaxID=748121 RepID=UPI001D04171D|nr:uncharacterized protein KVR01_007084 [Diaporthe batatas]KAG8163787.1 hypothetical protein KVR01_007084 [Diaporthe batatas]